MRLNAHPAFRHLASRLARVAGPSAILLTAAIPALAGDTSQAYRHALIGIEATAAARHAALLYREATVEELDLAVASLTALELERSAAVVVPWLEALANDPAEEVAPVAEELAAMRERAISAEIRSQELRAWIDDALEGDAGTGTFATEEFSARIARRTQEIFYDWKNVLGAHKATQGKLGLTPPNDPPVPPGGSHPAK